MQADPDEMRDPIDDPSHRDIAYRLESRLDAWFDCYVDPTLEASKQKNFGRGQHRKLTETGSDGAFADDWFYQNSGKHDAGPNL